MSRAKSVVPLNKRFREKHANNNILNQNNNTSFEASCQIKSPLRRPIQVYRKQESTTNIQSVQKRNVSGVKRTQYVEEKSNERLRIANKNTNSELNRNIGTGLNNLRSNASQNKRLSMSKE